MWQTIRKNLDLVQAAVLFSVSAALTFLLFFELAGTSVIYKVIFSVLALSFDGTKIVLWIRGTRERNPIFVTIAIALVGVSLICSSGSALMIVSKDDTKIEAQASTRDDLKESLASARDDVEAWKRRLGQVPPEYTSQVKVVAEELRKANERVASLESEIKAANIETVQLSASASTMFRLLSDRLGIKESSFKLLFLLAMSVLLESGALATSYRRQPKTVATKSLGLDASGVSHVIVKGRALCGKPAPFTATERAKVPCNLCMERSMKDA